MNYAEGQAKRGELDQALETLELQMGDRSWRARLAAQVALIGENWTRAESLSTALERDPAAGQWAVRDGAAIHAAVRANRGEVRRALNTLDSAHSSAAGRNPWRFSGSALLLRVAAGQAVPARRRECADSTAESVVFCAFHSAMSGNPARARDYLSILAMMPELELARLGSGPRLVQAGMAAASEQWDSVPSLLGRAVTWTWPEQGTVDAGNMIRWLVAESHERLGELDSAATIYEMFTAPPEVLKAQNNWSVYQGLVVYSFAHFRLGRLYTELAIPEKAKEHYATFLETFTRPDPEYEWMVTEARAKLEELARGR